MPIVPPLPWTGGIDRSASTSLADVNSAYNLKNVVPVRRGYKRIRGGVRSYYQDTDGTPIGVTGDDVTADINVYDGVRMLLPYMYGDSYRLLAVLQDGMYYRTFGGVQSVDNSTVVSNPWQMLQFSGQVLITAPSSAKDAAERAAGLYTWDGANDVVLVDSAPRVRFIRTHYNRLIASGNFADPTMLYVSFVGDVSSWGVGANPTDPDAGGWSAEIPGHQSITGISPSHYTGFFVSTDSALHFINGRAPSEYAHSFIAEGIGNFGHRTMTNVAGSIVGWNDIGCYVISDTDREGGRASAAISSPIEDIFREKAVRAPQRFFSIDNYLTREYVTFMPHIENSDWSLAIIWNYQTNQWYWHEYEFKVNSACMWSQGHDPLMIIGNDNSLLGFHQPGQLKDFDGTDWESNFEVDIQSQFMVMGDTEVHGRIKRIGALVNANRGGSLDVDCTLAMDHRVDTSFEVSLKGNTADFGELSNDFILGTSRLGRHQRVLLTTEYRGGDARYARFRIKDDAHNIGRLELYGVFFDVEAGGTPR